MRKYDLSFSQGITEQSTDKDEVRKAYFIEKESENSLNITATLRVVREGPSSCISISPNVIEGNQKTASRCIF